MHISNSVDCDVTSRHQLPAAAALLPSFRAGAANDTLRLPSGDGLRAASGIHAAVGLSLVAWAVIFMVARAIM